MPAYIVFNYQITNPERIDELSEISKEKDKNSLHNPKVIVASRLHLLEGDTDFPFMVIYEFETIQIAKEWYYDKTNQKVNKLRQNITNGWVSIHSGYILDSVII